MTTRDDTPIPNQGERGSRVLRALGHFFLGHFVLANETAYFLLVNALDVFITYLLLAWPDSPVREANPIARRMFHLGIGYLAAFKFGAATVSIIACEVIARRRRRLGQAILISLTVVVAAVCVYSVRLFLRHFIGR